MICPVLSPHNGPFDPIKLAATANSAGFDAVEVIAGLDLTAETVSQIRQLGITIACLSCPSPFSDDVLPNLIDQARTLEIPDILLPLSNPDYPYSQVYDELYDSLYKAAPQLDQSGLRLLLCVPQSAHLLSPLELRSLIDAVNSPNLGCCLDSGFLIAHRLRLADWVKTLSSRVFACRIEPASGISAEEIKLLSRLPGTVLCLASNPDVLRQVAVSPS